MKTRNTVLEDKMRGEGWLRPDEVAKRLSVSEAMIRGWASDDEKRVRARRVPEAPLGTLFVLWVDCVRTFGVENAVTVGAVRPEEAAKIKRAASG